MPGIFISYRREDSGPYAGRLYDGLVAQLGRDSVFFDIDTINPGEDFREAIRRTLDDCDVLLAVIGQHWAAVSDKNGKPRLESSRDFVRLEIASALTKGLRVIPVLVGGADMPDESLLPADLQPLAFRNAWEISDKRFHNDVQLLVDALQRIPSNVPQPIQPAPVPAQKRSPGRDAVPEPSILALYGVVLGKTTLSEIARIGTRAEHINDSTGHITYYYVIDKQNFWYDNDSNVINRMYIARGVYDMPKAWQKLGFEWQKSYREWLAQLKSMGYSIKIIEKPHVENYDGQSSFSATVVGTLKRPHPHEINLDFRFNKGTETTSPGTLYSIGVKA